MTDPEINGITSRILRKHLEKFGFQRSTVQSEQDFDGSSILRVVAHVKNPEVPPRILTNALHNIRSKLLSKGEERFVLLAAEAPEEQMIDEDVE